MENHIKETAREYIFGLMLACADADNSWECRITRTALEDLDGIIECVSGIVEEQFRSVPMETIAHYCTMYQQEALAQI